MKEYRIITGHSNYKIAADGEVIKISTGLTVPTVIHDGVENINTVMDDGKKKRTKLQKLVDMMYPENLPGVRVYIAPDYRITVDGKIYSTIQNRWLECSTVAENGYILLSLKDAAGKKINVNLHRALAMAYVEGYFVGAHVNHKDGNKLNNNVNNLEWVTNEENLQHAWETGLCDKKHRACELSLDGVEWKHFNRLIDAKAYIEKTKGIQLPNVSHLSRCAKKNIDGCIDYRCRGYIVKYSD